MDPDPAGRTPALLALGAVALSLMGRFGRRAALRGTIAAGAVTATTAVAARVRGRPALTTEVAAASAFAAGATLEMPALLAPLGGLAARSAARRARDGADPTALMAAVVAGASAALLTRRPWPVAPHEPAAVRRHLRRVTGAPLADGTGVRFVVNAAAGPALAADGSDDLRAHLPGADLRTIEDGEDLRAVLADQRREDSMAALGIAGGDGSVRAAAGAALDLDVPLVVVPTGTLNHLARDLGLRGLDDAVAAVQAGDLAEIDVGAVGDRPFLNTAAFGAYPDLVDARERLESTIGKWPAMVVALARVLRHATPLDVELDGRRRRVWMVFVGNCRYHPSGFAPAWRERLDDGQLDIRVVDATRPLARTRLLLAVLSGRLGRSQVYEQRIASSLDVQSLDGPLRLALDGEVLDGPAAVAVRKRPQRLRVFVPRS